MGGAISLAFRYALKLLQSLPFPSEQQQSASAVNIHNSGSVLTKIVLRHTQSGS